MTGRSLAALIARFAIGIFAVCLSVIWTVYGALVIVQSPNADARTAVALSLGSLTASILMGGVFAAIERMP